MLLYCLLSRTNEYLQEKAPVKGDQKHKNKLIRYTIEKRQIAAAMIEHLKTKSLQCQLLIEHLINLFTYLLACLLAYIITIG